MREIRKTYDDVESGEWRRELVEVLSLAVFDYLRREGLLRADVKAAGGSGGTAGGAPPHIEAGGRREEGGRDLSCKG